jgi:hypothetical protein
MPVAQHNDGTFGGYTIETPPGRLGLFLSLVLEAVG